MGWKKGYFTFRNEEAAVVMRVLSRYYNVEIQCDPDAAVYKFSASVARDKSLTEHLNQFRSMGLKFDTSGKIIKVTR